MLWLKRADTVAGLARVSQMGFASMSRMLDRLEEKDLLRKRDWIGLWRNGMTIYVMVKLSGVTNTALPEIGKQMRESGGAHG